MYPIATKHSYIKWMNQEVSLAGATSDSSVLCHRNDVTKWRQVRITCRSHKNWRTRKGRGLKYEGSEAPRLHSAQQFKTEMANSEVFESVTGDVTSQDNDPGGVCRFSEALS